MWEAGLDFAHGTGHGVGAYLSVHEGPARIAKPTYPGGGPAVPLEAGMILSNEPGYYKAGEYGIRIENQVEVVSEPDGFLRFRTLTLVPIDLRLADLDGLTAAECDWLNAYHRRVWREIGPSLKGAPKAWLKEATRGV